jgi:hypothetical protein
MFPVFRGQALMAVSHLTGKEVVEEGVRAEIPWVEETTLTASTAIVSKG